jgi:hypothetical protein
MLVGVAALLALAIPAFAQVVRQDGTSSPGTGNKQLGTMFVGGISRADSVARMLTLDSNGNLYTQDYARDRDNYGVTTIYNNQLSCASATFMDSSLVYDTHAYRWMALLFYVTGDSIQTGATRIAVSVRAHNSASADSASAYPWYHWPSHLPTGGNVVTSPYTPDSVGQFSIGPVNGPVNSTGVFLSADSLWDGEFKVVAAMARQVQADRSWVGVGAYPRGIYIPLVDNNGVWFRSLFTSVRFRLMTMPGAPAATRRVKLRVDLVGGS